MAVVKKLKRIVEKLTGLGRPGGRALARLAQPRLPQLMRLRDDGETPNNRLPLVVYRNAVRLDEDVDAVVALEETFARHGWRGAWHDGIYDFPHFHTGTHEVLGVARGTAEVEFGGRHGRIVTLQAGDVVVLPAGTGHCRRRASDDLLVVGAYPTGSRYDEPRPGEVDHATARAAIARVRLPRKDPVYGADGPLLEVWRQQPAATRPRRAASARRAKARSVRRRRAARR